MNPRLSNNYVSDDFLGGPNMPVAEMNQIESKVQASSFMIQNNPF